MLKQGTASVHRRERGFTLAEIMVTTAIFAIIMLAALAVYDRSNQTFKTSTEAADMQQSTRIGFDKLVADIRMAGFDYSRGGVPQNSWEAQQPDEQIEYAGPASVVFRANFNYNSAAGTGNGLESAFTPHNTAGQAIFPYVTTSNSEIVAYVLRSATTNNDSISFYADDWQPRAVFPSNISPSPAGNSPSRNEALVTITGIDTTNANPPYTLYRVTLADNPACATNGACTIDLGNNVGTPVAENIRRMDLQYYTDASGATLLTSSDGNGHDSAHSPSSWSIAANGAIGGDGQYTNTNVGSTTNFADRTQRSTIASIRVNLVGMNANPDLQGYKNANEPLAAFKSYRQYTLSSLVVPRNLGKTGFPEPSYNSPGQPVITGACIGHCGAPVLYWQPPTGGGSVLQYRIEWDSVQQGAYANGINVTDPQATSYIMPDDGIFDVSQVRYFRVTASNENGPGTPSQPYAVTPKNKTKPQPVANFAASVGQTNQISLTWNAPTQNATGFTTLACQGTGGNTDGTAIPPQETMRYEIWRGEHSNFDPTCPNPNTTDCGVVVAGFWDSTPPQPAAQSPGSLITWVDSATPASGSHFPPASCKTYYYRVRVADRCAKFPQYNVSNQTSDSISDFSPAIGQPAMAGSATSQVVPTAPASLTIDRTTPNATGCPDPQNTTSGMCRITLNWSKVTNDTAGNAIAVDTYRITRSVRIQGVGAPYLPDPLFGASGQQTVSCAIGTCTTTSYTQQSGGVVGYVDTSAPTNTNPGLGGQALEYQYTVAALGCAGAHSIPASQPNDPYSVESNAVQYPGCSLNPAIVETDAQTGNTSTGGDTPQNPWVMNSGDTIKVTPGAGTNVVNVQFQTSMYPSGTPVPAVSANLNAPNNGSSYMLTWSDQTDGQVYMVRIVVTNNVGCQETHVKYVMDQQGAPCAFPNQTLSPCPSCLAVPNQNNSNIVDTFSVNLTIPNNGTDPLQLANKALKIQWDLPAGDTIHTDLKLVSLVWTVPSTGTGITMNLTTPASLASPGPTVTTVTSPSNIPNLAIGASMLLQIRFQYHKDDDCLNNNCSNQNPPIVANQMTVPPLQKLCMDYVIASESTVTKHCNVVGQSASTANPTNCD